MPRQKENCLDKKPRHYPSTNNCLEIIGWIGGNWFVRECMSSSRDWNHVFLIKSFICIYFKLLQKVNHIVQMFKMEIFDYIDNDVEFLISIYANYVNENLSQSQKNIFVNLHNFHFSVLSHHQHWRCWQQPINDIEALHYYLFSFVSLVIDDTIIFAIDFPFNLEDEHW